MTREEKIQQFLDSKSRDEKYNDMRDSMWDWDTQSLIESAFSHMEQSFDNLSDKDFDDEYYEWFSYMFESEDFDDDEKPKIIILDECKCDLHQLMRGEGHDDNCPEKHA